TPYHCAIKEQISCQLDDNALFSLNEGDWVIAKMQCYPLKDNGAFSAKVMEFIAKKDDPLAPWLIALARNNLAKTAPELTTLPQFNDSETALRHDLCHLPFITIDNVSSKDLDD